MSKEVSELWKIQIPAGKSISDDYTPEEFSSALQLLKTGNAPWFDSISLLLIFHAGAALKTWLNKFLSSCMRQQRLPNIWRRASVVAIPKPIKPPGDPKSYRPVSLLRIPYEIMERLSLNRTEPIRDPLFPQEQAGFRCGRSTVDQVTLLTQKIEDNFSAKKKAGAMFVDLTAAYYTVWHRGLTCTLLRLLPDRHMVSVIMELVRNRSFTLTTGNGRKSRLQRPTGFSPSPTLVQHLYIQSASDIFQEICLCRRLGDPALHRRLATIRGDSHPGHENTILVSPELEPEAQSKQNGDRSLPPPQHVGTT